MRPKWDGKRKRGGGAGFSSSRGGKRKDRDKEAFKRRKYARNNYVIEEPVTNKNASESSEESSEEESNSYHQLLQVFDKNSQQEKTVTSESESDEEGADGNVADITDGGESDEGGADGNIADITDGAESDEGGADGDESDHKSADVGESDEEGADGGGSDEESADFDAADGSDVEDNELEDDGSEESNTENDDRGIQEEKNEKVKDIFGDAGLASGAGGDSVLDPFQAHFEVNLAEDLTLAVKDQKLESKTEVFPCLGKLQVQMLPVDADNLHKVDLTRDKKESLQRSLMQTTPKPEASLQNLNLKQTLKNNFDVAKGPKISEDLVLEMMSLMNSYKDLLWTERSSQNGEDVRLAYTCHALNHVLKTRTKILNNNARHERREEGDEGLRDQGLTRPKVLFVLPFRESARRVVALMEKLLFPNSKGNVANKKRFMQEFPEVEVATGNKPDDYYQTFAGDTDDSFNLGLAVTKKTLKLYTDFYSSDIIISSPLGLRLVLGAQGDKERNYDFLNSIELLIMDQTEIFMMQNWEHILCLLDDIHKQPKESRGTDFSRVRLWTLDGLNKFYRQTLLFSSFQFPELNSVFNRHCFNYFGKVRVMNPVVGGALSTIFSEVPVVFNRINSASPKLALEDRFEALKKLIHSKFMKDNMDHVMVFFSDYVDFVKARNWFKSSDLDYAEISEYTKQNKMAKARDDFYHNARHFLLYTERAHFYRRFTIKGIRHLIFYQMPLNAHLFSELCNFQQDEFQNKRGGSKSNMSCTVLYTKYDASRLVQCVGTEKAATMISAANDKHIFSPNL